MLAILVPVQKQLSVEKNNIILGGSRMKKRVISAVLATVMCLSMGATALAANSPETDNETEAVVEVEVSDVKVDAMEAKQKEAWTAAFGGEAAPGIDAIADLVRAQAGAAVKDQKIVNSGTADVQAPAGYTGGKATVTFKANVVASDNIIVYHLTASGNWERLAASAKDGAITATFTSFSPVVYVVTVPEKAASSSTNSTTTTQGTSGSTSTAPGKSPNTGVGSNAVLVAMFVMALGGAAWYGKKCFGNAR